MASNKIKALAFTSAIAMTAVIGSTSIAEARHYCRAHYGWHRHCGGTHWGYARPVRTYWGYAARPTYWGSAYRPMRYSRCYRPGYYGYGGASYYGSAWPTYGSSYGWGGSRRAITAMAAVACLAQDWAARRRRWRGYWPRRRSRKRPVWWLVVISLAIRRAA